MYEELASVSETVDLSPEEVLSQARAFLTHLGYRIVQQDANSLTVQRLQSVSFGGDYLLVKVLPQLEGGVRVKIRGTDRDGVFSRQAEWTAWAESLPKRGAHEPSGQAVGQTDAEQEAARDESEEVSTAMQESPEAPTVSATKGQTEASTPTTAEEQIRISAPPAPWERRPEAAAEKSEEGVPGVSEAEPNAPQLGEQVVGEEELSTPEDRTNTAKVVEAESFRLVNKEGASRALLTVEDDKPRLVFMDEHENVRLSLTLDPEGAPTLALNGSGSELLVRLATAANGSPAFDFVDRTGELRLRLASDGVRSDPIAPEGRGRESKAAAMADTDTTSNPREELQWWEKPRKPRGGSYQGPGKG